MNSSKVCKIESINSFLTTRVQARGQAEARDYDFSKQSLRNVRKQDILPHMLEKAELQTNLLASSYDQKHIFKTLIRRHMYLVSLSI